MRYLRLSGLAAVALIMDTGVAAANCSCECVNGHTEALCTSTIDLKPLCSTNLCPLAPPSVKPLDSVALPPLGTSSCSQEQVLNPQTHLYEWQRVCH
jgi:hypothetical protein